MKSILLLHGATGSAEQLGPLAAQLSSAYDVHRLSFPGHGGEDMPEEFSMEAFANTVKEYCRQNRLDKVSIFGYSMGGYVAMLLAGTRPVEKIITLATKFHWDEATALREAALLKPEIIEAKITSFAQALSKRHAPNDWKEVLQKTAAMLKELGKDPRSKTESYASIQTPGMIMLGDRDKMVTLEETVSVYKQLPNACLSVLPNTGHPLESADVITLAWMISRFVG